jgi:hypothetical protein
MFGQFLPNKNKILQCATIKHSDSASPNLGPTKQGRFDNVVFSLSCRPLSSLASNVYEDDRTARQERRCELS